MNKYGLYLLLGVIIHNFIDYDIYIYIYVYENGIILLMSLSLSLVCYHDIHIYIQLTLNSMTNYATPISSVSSTTVVNVVELFQIIYEPSN